LLNVTALNKIQEKGAEDICITNIKAIKQIKQV